MPVPSNWYTVVGERLITFFDHVWLHIGMLRTRYLIALARHKTAVETHRCRGSDDFSTVVSVVTDAYEIYHHFIVSCIVIRGAVQLEFVCISKTPLCLGRFSSLKTNVICSGNTGFQNWTACFLGDSPLRFSVDRCFLCLTSQMS